MPDFDTQRPQDPNEPNRLRTLLSATRPRIVLIANMVRSLLIANRLRTMLISGVLLLLVVAVPLGTRIYSSIKMGDLQRKLAGGPDLLLGARNDDPTDDIAFANGELSVIDADGTGLSILTQSQTQGVYNFDWSPDGQKIVFHRNEQVHVINADGTGDRILTYLPYQAQFDWSPDDDKIALAGEDLSVINADGTGMRKLTHTGGVPSFSPNGEMIAFGKNYDIFIIRTDGTGLKNLTYTPSPYMQNGNERPTQNGYVYGIRWSPSGEKIAFLRERDAGSSTLNDLYVMNTDGTGETLVTKDVSYVHTIDPYGYISFSPDGKKIAFTRQANVPGPYDDWDIYVTNTDGTRERQLTDTPSADESMPAWSSDGEKIAFQRRCENADEIARASASASASASDVDYIYGIYVMNADGTGERKLTNTSLNERMKIQWRPVE